MPTRYFSLVTPTSVAAAAPDLATALAREAAHGTIGKIVGTDVLGADVTTATEAALAAEALSGVTNEVVEVAVDGTGGTHTMTFGGQATATLAFNATAAAMEAALVAISTIGAGEVVVTGGPGDSGGTTPYYVQFVNGLGGTNVGAITFTGDLLTGGGSTVVYTVIQTGAVAPD